MNIVKNGWHEFHGDEVEYHSKTYMSNLCLSILMIIREWSGPLYNHKWFGLDSLMDRLHDDHTQVYDNLRNNFGCYVDMKREVFLSLSKLRKEKFVASEPLFDLDTGLLNGKGYFVTGKALYFLESRKK